MFKWKSILGASIYSYNNYLYSRQPYEMRMKTNNNKLGKIDLVLYISLNGIKLVSWHWQPFRIFSVLSRSIFVVRHVCVCVAICFFENFGNDSIFYPKCNCLLATNVETTIYFISINENELKNYGSIEYINKKGIRRYWEQIACAK